ncbi:MULTISPECIES: helix-turn-helix domain-containing protein [unclassified Sphingobacterium]|uniref:helix-turn-helix domain-containing protein n=1 Tax=unclassified Sphingobacterium TaxID=2609468 RepID=UPI0025E0DAD8|nr:MULTISPECIES: helix-turn-helix transcriptional regulator [unclassified Sphingobacterium]
MKVAAPHIIQSISELHLRFALPKPDHPLVSVIDFEQLSYKHSGVWKHFANDFYCITLKKGSNANFKYGQRDYDFNEGMMTFTKPGQVFSVTAVNDNPVAGYMLVFKSELIRPYSLGKNIGMYGFFDYQIAEALHLSEKEEKIISSLLKQMQDELKNNIDSYSQDVIVSHLDLLLNYSNRFYNRQFLTRKAVNTDLLSQLEQILNDYFDDEAPLISGLPNVKFIATQLHLSPNYLSDLLRNTTGQNAQQYIQHYLIEKAKELLTISNSSVSEIAYQLGFEYSQSFSKLFKKLTNQTPLAFRQSFN